MPIDLSAEKNLAAAETARPEEEGRGKKPAEERKPSRSAGMKC